MQLYEVLCSCFLYCVSDAKWPSASQALYTQQTDLEKKKKEPYGKVKSLDLKLPFTFLVFSWDTFLYLLVGNF